MSPRPSRLAGWLSPTGKNHVVAVAGEFMGTFMFLFFALGGTNAVNTLPSSGGSDDAARFLYISLSFGMSLLVNVWVFYRISGALFNPAVTLGLMAVGAVGVFRGVLFIIAQLAGGIAASAVLLGLMSDPLAAGTSLAPGTSVVKGLFIEMFLTTLLVFTILLLAVEKHRATFLAPVGIGLALFTTQLTGVPYTGGSLNPARSFGPSVVNASFDTYHWIYWVGPCLGAVLAAGLYKVAKFMEYETANPGQDDAGMAQPVNGYNNGPCLEDGGQAVAAPGAS